MEHISLGLLAMLGTAGVLLILVVLAAGSILLAAIIGITLWVVVRQRKAAPKRDENPGVRNL